jgi:hypothetical protein
MFDLTNKLGVGGQESRFAQHASLAASNSVTAELIAFIARNKHHGLGAEDAGLCLNGSGLGWGICKRVGAAVPPIGVDREEGWVVIQGLQHTLGACGTGGAVVLSPGGAFQPAATADIREVLYRKCEYLVDGGAECEVGAGCVVGGIEARLCRFALLLFRCTIR